MTFWCVMINPVARACFMQSSATSNDAEGSCWRKCRQTSCASWTMTASLTALPSIVTVMDKMSKACSRADMLSMISV